MFKYSPIFIYLLIFYFYNTESNKTAIVSIPIDMGEGLRPLSEVSMWEQLSLAAFLQRHWADNQVSNILKKKNKCNFF